MSGGNKRKLLLGISLIVNPQLVILDEVTAGLDPIIKGRLLLWMKNQYPEMAIVMITQKIEEVEEFADRLIIINEGKIVESGTLAEIKQRYDCNQYILQITPATDEEVD